MTEIECPACGAKFKRPRKSPGSHSEETKRKISAAHKGKKRGPRSEETKRKIAESNRGQVRSPEARAKMSASHKGVPLGAEHRKNLTAALPRGERHHNWKGGEVSYSALHRWLRKYYPKTGTCEECGAQPKRTEWANITGEYKRDRTHYRELCVSCHRKLDSPKALSLK